MNSRNVGSWIFGGLLLAFYIGFLIWAPAILPDFKLKMLGILSGLLTGLFAFFITGEITTKINAEISKGTQIVVQATSGAGFAVATVLWWGSSLGLVSSSSQAVNQLSDLLKSGQGASVQISNSTDRTLSVRTSPKVRELAGALAQSDPKYKGLDALQKDNITPQSFSSVASTLTNGQQPNADLKALQDQFGDGIGPYHFGMSPDQVNVILPRSFGDVSWEKLPMAGEYKGADVRYFWLPLADFPTAGPKASLYDVLPAFHACWSGQSYITFEFAKQQLVHISVRLLSDCTQHRDLLRQFAKDFSISRFNENGPVAFQVKVNVVTVAGYTGSDVSSLDVFLTDSPQI
jgi:hypothetical protein